MSLKGLEEPMKYKIHSFQNSTLFLIAGALSLLMQRWLALHLTICTQTLSDLIMFIKSTRFLWKHDCFVSQC